GEEAGVLDGNGGLSAKNGEELLILRGEALPGFAVVEHDHPNELVVVQQGFAQDGSRPGMLYECGMRIWWGLVVVNEQSCATLCDGASNRLTGPQAYLLHPLSIAVPGPRGEHLVRLIPEQDSARYGRLHQFHRPPGDQTQECGQIQLPRDFLRYS